MTLISCPECGKQVSDRADSCPNCGYPISKLKTGGPEERAQTVECPVCHTICTGSENQVPELFFPLDIYRKTVQNTGRGRRRGDCPCCNRRSVRFKRRMGVLSGAYD